MENINQTLKQYLIDEFLVGHGRNTLDADFPLVEEGIIDSLGIFIVTDFIEEEFGIVLKHEEIVFENFKTLSILSAVVNQKIQERSL